MSFKNIVLWSSVVIVFVGVVIRVYPELSFKIPKLGFVVHILLTGRAPPAYMIYDCYKPEEMVSWVKDGDVLVSTLAKSGTTWMLYLSQLIRIKGDEEKFPFHGTNTMTPWPSFVHKPGQTWHQIKDLMNSTILADGTPLKSLWDNEGYLFRVFKAHESPVDPDFPFPNHVIPIAQFPRVKFLAMVRDPVDILASFYPFAAAHSKEFREMWGGFPPVFQSTREMIDLCFKNGKDKEKMLGYQFLLYIKNWYKHRGDKNVLLLHYNDAVHNLGDVVRQLAKFYEIDLTQEQINIITKKASFNEMKKMADKFNYQIWGNKQLKNGEHLAMNDATMLRKGIIGDGKKNLFSESELEEINGYIESYLDPAILRWAREGGEFLQ